MNSNDFYKLKYLKYKNKYIIKKKYIFEQNGGKMIKYLFVVTSNGFYKNYDDSTDSQTPNFVVTLDNKEYIHKKDLENISCIVWHTGEEDKEKPKYRQCCNNYKEQQTIPFKDIEDIDILNKLKDKVFSNDNGELTDKKNKILEILKMTQNNNIQNVTDLYLMEVRVDTIWPNRIINITRVIIPK
jgi:hypothetical protein